MKQLDEILEGLEDDRKVALTLSNGSVFGLRAFEMVDESIYNRADLCVAEITSKIENVKDVFSIGNLLEFSIEEVVLVKDLEGGNILYNKTC